MKKKVVSKKANLRAAKREQMGKITKAKTAKKNILSKKNKKLNPGKAKKYDKSLRNMSENDDTQEILEDICASEDQQERELSGQEDDSNNDVMDTNSQDGEAGCTDSEEEQEDEGYAEPVRDIFSEETNIPELKMPKGGKHVVFDEDEDFEDFPSLLTSDSIDVKDPVDADTEDSDSDAPPDEGTISKGKDIFAEDNFKLKKEIINLKKQVKESRRLKHEKNREQRLKKRERFQNLEKARLPEDLLNAVAKEEKEAKDSIVLNPKKKVKRFDNDLLGDQLYADTVDEDDVISLNQGVKVKALQRQMEKHKSIASIAADFRNGALYKKYCNRVPSLSQRKMLTKQIKSGKVHMPF